MKGTLTQNFRSIERLLVVFILTACVLSFYLTVMNYDVSRPRRRQRNTQQKHHIRKQDHQALLYKNSRSDHELSRTNVDEDVEYKKWFSVLPVNSAKDVILFNNHPIFKGYILNNNKLCVDKKVDILIYFHSATDHFENRRLLRETWASRTSLRDIRIQRVFLVGKPSNSQQQLQIVNEQVTYGDIVQGDFVDSRKNLTYKAIMAVAWISQFCAHARYIVKADDDIFANIFLLVEDIISKMSKKPRILSCKVHRNGTSPIIRNQKSKWFVPNDIFPGKTTYPDFCPGFFVVFSGDLAPIMYKSTYTNTFFDIDDVYLFGMSLEKTRAVTFVDISYHLTLNPDRLQEQYKSDDPISYIASVVYKPDDLVTFWMMAKKRLTDWAKIHWTQLQAK